MRLLGINLVLGCIVAVSGCVSTTSGEFSTGGEPTSNNSEKIELITGVSSSAISSISFSQKAKSYLIIYRPDRITKTELAAAEQRMCRYRRLTFDRSADDAPLTVKYNGPPPPGAENLKVLRTRSFFCR